jgi:serine/threonine protein kinase
VQIQHAYASRGYAVCPVVDACVVKHVSVKPASEETPASMYVSFPRAKCDLYDVLSDKKRRVSLADAQPLLKGLAEALRQMHQDGVVHRDIKIENVLVYKEEDGSECWKWTDFEYSRSVAPGERPSSPVGTDEYVAPERKVLRFLPPKYDAQKSDVWAFGALLYMVAAKQPFNTENELRSGERYIHSILQQHILREHCGTESFKQSCILVDLLLRMLEINPEKRCSMDEVCAHPFFTQRAESLAVEGEDG